MLKISGLEISEDIFKSLKKQKPPEKFLAVFLIGDCPSSASFIRQKKNKAKELGVDFRLYIYPKEIKNDKLRRQIRQVVQSNLCGAAIIQLPLPAHLNPHYAFNIIPVEKDVDVLGERGFGAFCAGRSLVLPPAVATVKTILEQQKLDLSSLEVAIIGSGLLVGKPISIWLMGKCRQIYILGKGSDFSVLKQADLVISGAGQAEIFNAKFLKQGAGVIDFGCCLNEQGKLVGDFDVNSFSPSRLSFYTPTPGGTGPIVVAKLFENFYRLSKRL